MEQRYRAIKIYSAIGLIAVSTLKELFSKGINDFRHAGIETPTLEVGVIICEILKCDESFLFAHNDYEFSEIEKSDFFEMIEKRIGGMPLQYLTGHSEFMSLDFIVNKNVLIPRQDTEILVETIIKYVKENYSDKTKKIRILDIGSGSGCIGISLAYYLDNVFVIELDKSKAALEIAKQNSEKNGVSDKMDFVECDVLKDDCSKLVFSNDNSADNLQDIQTKFDIIVSNPPYVKSLEIESLKSEVRDYEPMEALLGGEDGLDFYRSIVENSPKLILPNGLLAFEVGYQQAHDVKNIMSKRFDSLNTIKDLSGINRVVSGISIPPKRDRPSII
ncbi:MAG: peptide chain release factor N(5)-glutamine methyltransferase [Clostridia bacterium]|jgi:release factor glutamine methyltransferase